MPLVEVGGGRLTSEESVKRALTFYGSIGKKPIHIRREVRGHVANRLQAALWREAFYLVDQGAEPPAAKRNREGRLRQATRTGSCRHSREPLAETCRHSSRPAVKKQ
jgi:hypothetical protein